LSVIFDTKGHGKAELFFVHAKRNIGYVISALGNKSIDLFSKTTDRKIIVDEMIDDELSDYSLRLSNWRNKYRWKYFVDGGDGGDKPFKD
jgi:hypothetical protein